MQPKSFLHEIEQRFDELRHEILNSWGESRLREGLMMNVPRMPACDLNESGDAYTLTLELPGMDKSDVRLDVDERGAHVRAEHKEERQDEKRGFVRQERASKSFERYVAFPQQVAPDGARATFKNGVLDVQVPKAQSARRNARAVEIA